MANKSLFSSIVGKLLPATDAVNREHAPAYAFTPQHALGQLASTGCFRGTFYATAEEQLDRILELARQVEPEFLAKTAVYARTRGQMKDAPALLLAELTVRDGEQAERIFNQVVDSARMLRTFVQILRSGVCGRKSLGSRPKRLVRQWLGSRSDAALFRASVGQSPSLSDILKMVHPRPATPSREALYGYLLDREHDAAQLPELVQRFEDFKRDPSGEAPDVPFRMLTALPLQRKHWVSIARNAPWQALRMNLNTFVRHGVFDTPGLAEELAQRLRDAESIRRARALPYQLLVAYRHAGAGVPAPVREALQDAMELALENVPTVEGSVVICPDVSGSMTCPATGWQKGSSSKVRCVDVAALFTAAMVRKNPSATVLPFDFDVVGVQLNPRDSVMTNAGRLASVGGGGTNCSAPLRWLNRNRKKASLVVYVSDNQSWVDAARGPGTGMLREWQRFRSRNPEAKLVCMDIAPYTTSQVRDREDILNVGGFSDQVFDLLSLFAAGRLTPEHWVGEIERVEL